MSSSKAFPGVAPVTRATITSRLAGALTTMIEERFEPGERLPSERALCQMYGVGRTTLREALRILQSQGRVDVRAGRGAYVTAPPPATPFSQWPERLDTTVEELLQVRLVLEPPAAAMAAASDVDTGTKAAALREPLELMRLAIEHDELERRVAADLAFHLAIAELSDNRIVLGVLRELGGLLVESRRISLSYGDRLETVQSAHEAIRDAILVGDAAGAAQAMNAHLTRFADDMGLADCALIVPAGPAAVTDVSRLAELGWAAGDAARAR